jgi:hypothetical protein
MKIFDQRGSFDPVDIAVMAKAYELGCRVIAGRPETDWEKLAELIVAHAKTGERDPNVLHQRALNDLGIGKANVFAA